MRSAPSASLKLEIEKRFAADRAYAAPCCSSTRIHNLGAVPIRTAPWQITRVSPGGLTFYPSGEGLPPSNLGVQDALGSTWYDYDRASITEHQKRYRRRARRVAGACRRRDALLVKTFPAVPRAAHAPGRGADRDLRQPRAHLRRGRGAGGLHHETVEPGGALTWRVVWLARRLPEILPISVGSEALLAHVRALVAADVARYEVAVAFERRFVLDLPVRSLRRGVAAGGRRCSSCQPSFIP